MLFVAHLEPTVLRLTTLEFVRVARRRVFHLHLGVARFSCRVICTAVGVFGASAKGKRAHFAYKLIREVCSKKATLAAHFRPLGAVLIGALLLAFLAQVLLVGAHLSHIGRLWTQK